MWAIYKHEDFKLPLAERDKLYNSVLEESYLDPEYLTMLGLSSLIALFGLLQNSAAVIIGAMLISPLMNPILSAALALTLGDGRLGRKAAAVLSLSVGGAILITWILASFVPLKQATPEILARTNPNLLDLGIAVFSGLAGTLALRSHKASMMIIPGVAIAVAVVPPLAVVGYAVSNHHFAPAGGAFLLFITNLVSIIISAAVVFLLMGFRPRRLDEEGRLKLKYRLAISAGVLAVLSIPLVQTLRSAVRQVSLRSEIQQTLDEAFKTDHSSVTDLSFSRTHQGLMIHGTLRTTEYFDDEHIHAAEDSLRKNVGDSTHLEIDQILVTQGGLTPQAAARIRNFISAGVVQPATNAPEPPFDFKSNEDKILTFLQRHVDEILAGTPLKRSGELKAQLGRPVLLDVALTAPAPLENQTVQTLADQLSAKLSAPVELHGQVNLQGADYTLIVESSNARRPLALKDRQAISKLVAVVLKRPDLSLQVKVSPAEAGAEQNKLPALGRAVQTLLSQSRLNSSRWKIEMVASPPAARPSPSPETPPNPSASAKASPPAAPLVTRCEFQVIQKF
jgi:uncharacterized hydrophobic protein (TIGR00271 family)